MPYIFTYQKQLQMKIPTTTNGLDGGVFSPLKNLLSTHNGMNFELRKKLIEDFLITLKK